jgi:hypothetical protein
MITKAYVTCPLDGSEHQKYCSLVESYKDNGNANECPYRNECSHQIKPIDNEGDINEILA